VPSSSRAISYDVLLRVERDGAYANAALEAALLREPDIDPRDAALASELVHGVLRRQLALDAALAHASERSLERIELPVLVLLRLGCYQLLYLDRIPEHAAVHETVELAKSTGLARASGLANAVLRRIARNPRVPLPDDPLARISIEESHPLWLVRRWAARFGMEEARALCQANNQPAPLCLRVNLTKTSREVLLTALRAAQPEAQIEPGRFAETAVTLRGAGAPVTLPGYREGHFQVQDEAAQLIGIFTDHRAGNGLDVCAAPGGKACHMAERSLHARTSSAILALDISPNKLRRVGVEATRLGLTNLHRFAADARSLLPVRPRSQNAVLVDAPCSGLGTLRRHPELRYRRREEDLARLSSLQWQILASAADCVAPGGTLTYAVCSGELEEWEAHRERLLGERSDFEAAPSPARSFGREDAETIVSLPGVLETWPHRQGIDGFAAFRLRRTG
jgi:16S rRNA (cytosine967-C5)-methyltransferase